MALRRSNSPWPMFLLLAGLLSFRAEAQHTSPEGFRLSWNNAISVERDTLLIAGANLPSWSITVHETSAKAALDLWRIDVSPNALRVRASRPMVATGVKLGSAFTAPVDVHAVSTHDRLSSDATLTLVFISLGHDERLEGIMRDLSVRLNRALVQEQIDAITKDKSDSGRDLEREQKNEAKLGKRLDKANWNLETTLRQKSRTQQAVANRQGDLNRQERRVVGAASPRQLKRLTRSRRSLTGDQRQLARQMRDVARTQREINKLTRDLQNSTAAQQAIRSGKDLKGYTLDALNKKKDSIQ